MKYEDEFLKMNNQNMGNLPVIHLLKLYAEGEMDYVFVRDMYQNVAYVLDGREECFEENTPYGKSEEEIYDDCVTLIEFLISTKDFIFRDYLIDDEFFYDAELIRSETFRNYLKSIKKSGVDFTHMYCLDKQALGKLLPDVIPDHIKMIFSKDRHK